MNRAHSLPSRQPQRAILVFLLYLAAVAAVSGLLQLRFSGPLSAVLSVMWAMALLVPLAVLAPREAAEVDLPADDRPVLKRSHRSRDSVEPAETTSPADVGGPVATHTPTQPPVPHADTAPGAR